ncbi:hypothetical protein [Pseudomonas typographi]|uniref:Uncharacterized protein n=1 Tax=Pseudomonas typographi TaxID=2715964 RepID=A0ABR7Z2U9_9PSED|nr:hypothetical protein [Pseudomonas typographi]MBD1554108.1 hypothetical protein [Pseudomonas typographi]MBD1588557.1 hypothetical protein [Pseudomonas typographi]MBD1599824.1 hypothetical protein [Pseudomonas typographi]
MRDASSFHLLGDHPFLIDESIGDLDLDLVKSLVALDSPENMLDETRQPTGSILVTAASWFVVGIMLWALVGFIYL